MPAYAITNPIAIFLIIIVSPRLLLIVRLPLGDAAIPMLPYWIVPAMALFAALDNVVLVNIDSKPRPLRDINISVAKMQHARVAKIVG